MISMPGESYRGPLPELTEEERELSGLLRRHVEELAGRIGPRHVGRYDALQEAAGAVESAFAAAGYEVRRQGFEANGRTCYNLEVELRGTERPEEIVVVGGHYDSAGDTPAANDNATGTAAVLALARAFAGSAHPRTVRWVAFVNEEPPYFQTDLMGSRVYARRCRQRGENIVAMLSLETMGYYSDEDGSQHYPFPFSWFYPSTGNFIGFVGNVSSSGLVKRVVSSFRRHARFPSEGAAVYGWIAGIGWSDHWSFWKEGYPALMVTDTAPFRYPHYHSRRDTPDKVQYDRLARVVAGLRRVVEELLEASE